MKRVKDRPRPATVRGLCAAAALSLLLAACGSGGDGAPPTELPQALALSAPAKQQALGAPVAFASNAGDPERKLTYLWDFGDGTTSTLPDPSHAYARPGLYTVRLTVTNEAGASRTATATVAAADTAIVQDRVCSGADGTGWCWQRPLPQGNIITDYVFVDDLRGWAVGEAGTLLATADGGASWQAQASGTELDLYRPAFVNAQVGWVAATNGELLKTRDGGTTWQRVSFGHDLWVRGLGAADADTAWVTAGYDEAYVTTDGGARWKRIAAPAGTSQLRLSGPLDAWAVPYPMDTTLVHSVDGGASWSGVALPPVEAGLDRYIEDLQVADARHALVVASESGWVGGGAYVARRRAWRTADAGATWQAIGAPPGLAGTYGIGYYLPEAGTLYARAAYPHSLWRSGDGGTTWQAIALPALANAYVVALQASSARQLMLEDSAGRVHLSTDAGAHWTERSARGPSARALSSIWFFDAREGLAIDADGGILRTADGGRSWAATEPANPYGYGYGYGDRWRRAQFLPDGSIGWVISDSGTIYRSTDKGRTWLAPVPQTSARMDGLSDFHFVDALHGWAVAPYSWYGSAAHAIYSSADGGSSWQPVADTETLSGLVSVRFGDAQHGVAVGPAGVAMVSDDGGRTWTPRPTGVARALRRVAFADARTAVAVGEGGAVVRSTDQGRTWSRVASPTTETLQDVRFLSATTGYAVGGRGTLLVTRDGGASWTPQRTGARAGLQTVYFLDEQTGWVAGDNGAILATVSGGR